MESMWLACFAGLLVFQALVAAIFFVAALLSSLGPPRRARISGGSDEAFRAILQRIPLLFSCPRGPLDFSSSLQLLFFAVEGLLQERRFESQYRCEVEEFEVTLPGESSRGCPDTVAITWVLGEAGAPEQELPPDAPVVILCAGLNCYTASLPGTSTFSHLLRRPWRVGVFEKRGVGPADGAARRQLRSPAFHLFGHPSDLHAALLSVQDKWPKAPIHIAGMSSGNGLAGSYVALHGKELQNLRSAVLLIGGEDYNCAFTPPKGNWLTRVLFDVVLLKTTKTRFLHRNEGLLRSSNEEAFQAALRAKTLQELYHICMKHFSGYECAEEAERRINGFSGGCECLRTVPVPMLCVFTDDDPVAPGGPRPCWVSVIQECERSALAVLPCGSHLGCYEGWRLTRWVDRLLVQWIEAVTE